MLPRHNRIVQPGDFRQVVRRGDKHVATHVIVYRRPSDLDRVGVIVTKKTGNAVVRNRLRRRTRAITKSLIDNHELTGDVIVRFRDSEGVPTFDELDAQLRAAARKLVNH